jgi:predicted TIM-barrel fold metal-dependent hydrolase
VAELGGYPWLDPEFERDPILGDISAICSPAYRPENFMAESRFHNVRATVHVQAAHEITDPVAETRWLQQLAARFGHPHGIVAYADLAAPDAEETLDRHLEYANVRGIRDYRYDDYYVNRRWERGIGLLGSRGLVLTDDPLLEHVADCAALAARHPEVTFCIDHAGFPRARTETYFKHWSRQMRKLASVDNTVVKISGLAMVDHRWTVDTIRPWIHTCIDAWGVNRVFFGTNWPIDRLYGSYGDVIDAFAAAIEDFDEEEQRSLFSANAERIFRLGPAH